ncbi:MAG: aspartate 1-decarboxylase [Deltaproteobacteria bacterium]|nr:MAG: aspartate 1-decarboxylase [Deltaproteobacteria bacterium]
MQVNMFKSKIHRATVTEANPDYEGSVTIDSKLMEAANMLPYEQVHVWDVDNGARLTSYILAGPPGSGTICMNGAAALLVEPGHRVILATFASMDEQQARTYQPQVVLVDANNRITSAGHHEHPFVRSA